MRHKHIEKVDIVQDDDGNTAVRVVYWYQKPPTRGVLRHTSFYSCNPTSAEHLKELLNEQDQNP